VGSPQGRHLPSAPSNREIEDEDDDEDEDEKAPQGTGFPTVFSLSWPKYSAIPAAPIPATPHFVAFFVPRVVVYASSQDFIETAISESYLNIHMIGERRSQRERLPEKDSGTRNSDAFVLLGHRLATTGTSAPVLAPHGA
jgi:hypothetical protein